MGSISRYTTLTDGVPPDTSYLTSNDGYLHVYNCGPQMLVANYTTADSPSAPSDGIPMPPGEWTLLPADQEDGAERIAFAPVPLTDGFSSGSGTWAGMLIWTT